MVNPLDIYARAVRRMPLTAGERALLRTADQLLLSALAGALLAVAQTALAGGQQLSLATIGQVALYAGASAIVTGAAKLFRARGDALGTAVAQSLDQAAQQYIPQSPAQPQQPTSSTVAAMEARMRAYAIPPQRRAQLLTHGGAYPLASASQPGATTQPTAALSAADVAATTAQAAQSTDEPPEAPAPSQRVVAQDEAASPDDEATGDGPTTLQTAAVRPGTASADAWTTAG